MAVDPPEIPRYVHSVTSQGQITIPVELRRQIAAREFIIFEADGQIVLDPVDDDGSDE